MFVSKCLTSDNSMVNFVARHGVYVLRQNSPVGSNVLCCCTRFGLRLDMLKRINRNLVSRRVSIELHAYNVTASVIYDLLCVKSHQAELSILIIGTPSACLERFKGEWYRKSRPISDFLTTLKPG